MTAYSLGTQSAWAATTHTPQTFTAPKTFLAGSAGDVPIVVKAAIGQTANIQEWQDSAGTVHAAVHAIGRLQGFNGVTAAAGSPAGTALAVQGAVGQTQDLVRFLDSGGTVLSAINSGGGLAIGGPTVIGRITSYATSAGDIPLVARGVGGQTADLQRWQDSGGVSLAKVLSNGSLVTTVLQAGATFTTTTNYATIIGYVQEAGTRGLVVRGAASQTANLVEFQNSSGTALSRIKSNGDIAAGGTTDAVRLGATYGGLTNQTELYLRYSNGTIHQESRVTIGAADSGGAGFRYLRVAN